MRDGPNNGCEGDEIYLQPSPDTDCVKVYSINK